MFGGGNNTGCFCKLIQGAVTATVSSAFLKFSLWFYLEVRLIYSLIMNLKRKTNIFFQCCSVCIAPHCLVPMIQSLYQTLPCFPSAVPGPRWDQWVICWAGGRISQGTWLVSSNHVLADQLFWNITTLPHLHVYYASCYILMQFDAALRSG